jgi:ubiquinone/menaquinone biosynthesis C-methylase UbiE
VTSFNSLDHVDDLRLTLREIVRVLMEGGRFLLITEVNHEATPTEPVEIGEAALRRTLEPHFQVISWRTFEMSFQHDVYRSVREGVERPLPADTAGIVTASLLKH